MLAFYPGPGGAAGRGSAGSERVGLRDEIAGVAVFIGGAGAVALASKSTAPAGAGFGAWRSGPWASWPMRARACWGKVNRDTGLPPSLRLPPSRMAAKGGTALLPAGVAIRAGPR